MLTLSTPLVPCEGPAAADWLFVASSNKTEIFACSLLDFRIFTLAMQALTPFDRGPVYMIPFSFNIGLGLAIQKISPVYTMPFSFHIGLVLCHFQSVFI